MMDLMQSFDAILFPADGRPPHVVSLMTSPASFSNHPHAPAQTSAVRIPHPEVHMEYIAEDPNLRAWDFQVCCILCFFFFPFFLFWTMSFARTPFCQASNRFDASFTPSHSHSRSLNFHRVNCRRLTLLFVIFSMSKRST